MTSTISGFEGDQVNARRVGYALCLATDPADADRQRRALVDRGCDTVHIDQGYNAATGTGHAGFATALADCHTDAVLVVTSLARLAPRLRDLQQMLAVLAGRHVRLEVDGTDLADLQSVAGDGLLRTIALVLDYETAAKRLRSTEGKARSAAAREADDGRPPVLDDAALADLQLMRDSGVKVARLAVLFGISQTTVYRHTKPPSSS